MDDLVSRLRRATHHERSSVLCYEAAAAIESLRSQLAERDRMLAEAREATGIYKAAFKWWRKWPEWVPSPEYHEQTFADVKRASELWAADERAYLQGEPK